MVQRGILPAVSRYTDQLAVAVSIKKADSLPAISVKMEETTLLRLSELSEKLFDTCEALTAALSKAPAADSRHRRRPLVSHEYLHPDAAGRRADQPVGSADARRRLALPHLRRYSVQRVTLK